jgi:hypothetical protein
MHTRTAMMPHPATMPRTKSLGEKELGIDECCSVDERIGDGSRPCGFVAVVAEQLKGQKVPCSSGGVLKVPATYMWVPLTRPELPSPRKIECVASHPSNINGLKFAWQIEQWHQDTGSLVRCASMRTCTSRLVGSSSTCRKESFTTHYPPSNMDNRYAH